MKLPQAESGDDMLGTEQTWTPLMIPLEGARFKADMGSPKPRPTCLLTSVVPPRENISVPRALLRDTGEDVIPWPGWGSQQ